MDDSFENLGGGNSDFAIQFNSIQDYFYSAFHDTIAAKQFYIKLSFYNRFIYCRNLIYLTHDKIWLCLLSEGLVSVSERERERDRVTSQYISYLNRGLCVRVRERERETGSHLSTLAILIAACVWEWERDRERERDRVTSQYISYLNRGLCVRVRESERERERETGSHLSTLAILIAACVWEWERAREWERWSQCTAHQK